MTTNPTDPMPDSADESSPIHVGEAERLATDETDPWHGGPIPDMTPIDDDPQPSDGNPDTWYLSVIDWANSDRDNTPIVAITRETQS